MPTASGPTLGLPAGWHRPAPPPPPPTDLSYKDRHWHEACFHCSRCESSLVDKPFAAKEDQLLCTDCYSHEYSSRCQECKKTIMPGQDPRARGSSLPSLANLCRGPVSKHACPRCPGSSGVF
ncbi:hypothetical protein QTO34_012857 [Cnephaeus nilssonii]|uniref:LIM zinc-binding domain-containing protein n=1 Tax=Cnephaeus nilssonii TaxID=3371016 RepID=A0AA40HAK4_CNENI|nr:hypothetical protein QTO34_012857 [Eptesicus nilssonii]